LHDSARRLTDRLVRAAPAPKRGYALIWDGELRGFALRVSSGGAKAFVLNYRSAGRERRLTIGRYPDWSVAAAREEARRLKRLVNLGEDPMGTRHELREAPTVADWAALYESDHLPRKRPSSQRVDRAILKKEILPRLGRLRVAEVRHRDVFELHRAISARAPVRANRVLAVLSKMFAMAVAPYEMRADNPVRGVPRNPERARRRYLSPAELTRLSAALERYPAQNAADAVRLLLLTGARKAEVLSLTWEQLDLEGGLWIKPSAHTKQKAEHWVPLNAPARALLSAIRARPGGGARYVFPNRKGDGPLTQLSAVWQFCRREAGLRDARLHDLRHTYASILASSGLSLPLIGALLGHTQARTTERYAHLYDDPLREAAERVGAVVAPALPVPDASAGQGDEAIDTSAPEHSPTRGRERTRL
jgi:integrase